MISLSYKLKKIIKSNQALIINPKWDKIKLNLGTEEAYEVGRLKETVAAKGRRWKTETEDFTLTLQC